MRTRRSFRTLKGKMRTTKKKGLWMQTRLKRARAKSLGRANQLHHGYITKTWRVIIIQLIECCVIRFCLVIRLLSFRFLFVSCWVLFVFENPLGGARKMLNVCTNLWINKRRNQMLAKDLFGVPRCIHTMLHTVFYHIICCYS